jgi:hypothetical protein
MCGAVDVNSFGWAENKNFPISIIKFWIFPPDFWKVMFIM